MTEYLFIKGAVLGNILKSEALRRVYSRLITHGLNGVYTYKSLDSIKKEFGFKTRSGLWKVFQKLSKLKAIDIKQGDYTHIYITAMGYFYGL